MSFANNENVGKSERRSLFVKLKLLMWKNFIYRKRYWVLTVLEILMPIIFMVLIVYLKNADDSNIVAKKVEQNTYFNETSEEGLLNLFCSKGKGVLDNDAVCNINNKSQGHQILYWGPVNNLTEKIMKYFANHITFETVEYVESTSDIDGSIDQAYLKSNDSSNDFFVGIFFNDGETLNDFNYSIRLQHEWFTKYPFPIFSKSGPRKNSEKNIFDTKFSRSKKGNYTEDGFILIQSLLDRAFIDLCYNSINSTHQTYTLRTKEYPYPPYVSNSDNHDIYLEILSFAIIFSIILMMPILITGIVYEKQTGVKEFMCLMGMERRVIWLGWFMYSIFNAILIPIIITVSITSQFGSYAPYFAFSSPSLIWFILFLYSLGAIFFCFATSCFFNSPPFATIIGIIIWMIFYISFFPLRSDNNFTDIPVVIDLLTCLHPSMAIFWVFKITGTFEEGAVGIRWNNLWVHSSPTKHLTIGMIILMLLFDSFMFLLITWYIDEVKPGIYGVPKPWYFIFTKKYWKIKDLMQEDEEIKVQSDNESNRKHFEKEPQGLNIGIKINALRKVFKSSWYNTIKVVAVDNVSLNCYEGQCTVLLGHNGAGKTTTMSILTGVYAPSGGSATILGWDIHTHLKEARAHIGYCPQYNIFFRNLSVLEHLLFFAQLKGCSYEEAVSEAAIILNKFELYNSRDKYGRHLSGGMKRMLSLAIALIGKSRVIILDEPSSGLDPEARRWVWDVIQEERSERTFLVTTHHMEEADILGDRVAIMANGNVVCCGSSLFLKYKFGDGYTLSVTTVKGAKVEPILDILKAEISNSALRYIVNSTLEFRIPPETGKFARMLNQISLKKTELGILNMGLSLTSMDQVFLRVGAVLEDKEKNIKTMDKQPNIDLKNYRAKKLKGWQLFWSRISSLFVKRFIYSKRNWLLLFTQAVFPLIAAVQCLLADQHMAHILPSTYVESPIKLSMDMFEEATYSYVCNASDKNKIVEAAESYFNLFKDSNEVEYSSNLTDDLLAVAIDDLSLYRERYITSAEFKNGAKDEIDALMMHQSIPYHSAGIGINLISNAVLQSLIPDQNYTITTFNAPLPLNKTHADSNQKIQDLMSAFIYFTNMPFALASLTSSYLVFPLDERVSNAKQIQVMTGTSTLLLWITSYIWDIIAYSLSALPIFGFFVGFDNNEYFTPKGAPGALLLMLLLYGFSSIPMAYVFSLMFKDSATGFVILAILNLFAGTVISFLTTIILNIDSPLATGFSIVIGNVTSFIPTYAAAQSFLSIIRVSQYNQFCDSVNRKENLCNDLKATPEIPIAACCPLLCQNSMQGCFEKMGYLDWQYPSMGLPIFYLCIDCLLFFIILTLIELRVPDYFKKETSALQQLMAKSNEKTTFAIDSDVTREQHEASSIMNELTIDDSAIVLKDLTKVFTNSNLIAVDHISFHVPKGQCFGLLGVNGAGKTTTLRMLTGDLPRTAGDARIGDHFLSHGRKQFIEEIGYCPQYNGMIKELTGREMLSLMASLRGVPGYMKKQLIDRLLQLVDLSDMGERPCGDYSGGHKRKLSVAMALVGEPPLVLLDEPTSGVDPASRRKVWDALKQVKNNGQSVILSSHSMDECEALCDKMVIMVQGTFRCVGSFHHLRSKFGEGYTLQVKIRSAIEGMTEKDYIVFVKRLKRTILRMFKYSTLNDEHRGMVIFRVPSSFSWSSLFKELENLKRNSEFHALVEDYAAMDPSLEQIFLSFARKSKREDDIITRTQAALAFSSQ